MAVNLNNSGDESISEINITPFVDVVLVLLVIFMVTAPMIAQQAINIELPSAKSSDETGSESIGIAVTATGQILLNGEITSKDAVLGLIEKKLATNKNIQVIIAADGLAAHKHVITAIDLAKQAGVENFAFQVNRVEENGPTSN
jgi:biopolymer transport protein ExbD